MRLKTLSCRVCGCNDYHQLMEFNNMPAGVQNMPTKEELADDEPLDITLCQCKQCGLVQFPIEPVGYFKDVIRAGGGTVTMRNLRHEEYSRLLDCMAAHGIDGGDIIEVGCGRGEFLEMWKDLDDPRMKGISVFGIEHSKELINIAESNGLTVEQNYAEGNNTYFDRKFDAFVQFNFLEHQANPADMLKNIWKNLKENAVGLITVPSFEYILDEGGYYELMRDHISNFTAESLRYLVENNGFKVLDSRMVNRDTLEMILERTGAIEDHKSAEVTKVDVSKLIDNYEDLKAAVSKHVDELKHDGKTMAIWGASHQAFTLAATTQLASEAKYMIDSAKFKQGKYAQASHLQIVAADHFFEEPVDEILIIAPGYTNEIAAIIEKRFGSDVKILMLKDRSIKDFYTGEVI